MCILLIIIVIVVLFLFVVCSMFVLLLGVIVVSFFDVQCYLGIWYEIVCFDYFFESGLEKVMIVWYLCDDGGLDVVNKGYNFDCGMWQKMDGVVYFIGEFSCVVLKIFFFGFFYGSYNVIVLDKEYCYVLVCGFDCDYFWLLVWVLIIVLEVRQQMLDIVI